MSVMAMMVTNAVLQAVNGIATRHSTSKQQQQQQEFQKALQQQQWERSRELQLEIHRSNLQETQKRQAETQEHQRLMARNQALRNSFPLSILPEDVWETAQACRDSGAPPPLHIITSQSSTLNQTGIQLGPVVDNALTKVRALLGTHYGLNGDTPVQCYDSRKELGPQEITNIFSVFKGLPTVVLNAQCEDRCLFVLSCYYWGLGGKSMPEYTKILSCNIQELQRAELRHFGEEWPRKKSILDLPDNAVLDKLAILVKEEKQVLEEKRGRGATEEDIKLYVQPIFDKRYNERDILAEVGSTVNRKLGEMLDVASRVTVPLIADSYFLMLQGAAPKLLSICEEDFKKYPELISVSRDVFNNLTLNHENHSLRPLMHARLANAYNAGGYGEMARDEYSKGVNQLKQYGSLETLQPLLSLPDFEAGYKALFEIQSALGENRLPEYDKSITHEDQNKVATAKYQQGDIQAACAIWKESARRGNAKAAYNLAQVLELRLEKAYEAARYYKLALELGFEIKDEKLLAVAKLLTKQGDWLEAFPLWGKLISMRGEQDANAAVISSLFILTTVEASIPENQKRAWGAAMVKFAALGGNLSYQNLALEYLGEAEQSGNRLALVVLQQIAKRLWMGSNEPLVPDWRDGGKLAISAEQLHSVKHIFMSYLNRD